PTLFRSKCGFEECKELGDFDVIICSEVFEHVTDYRMLVELIKNQLKIGGFLSISTPSGWMFRTLRLSNVKHLLLNPRKYFRTKIKPEHNWEEALKIHPAIQPRKLINMLKSKGFKLLSRQSSLWLMSEKGICFRTLKFFETIDPIKPAIYLHHYCNFVEALMNICPFFRIFESRFILLMQKME
ncbi:MAG: hypothetical protein PHG23_02900, partial [Candidatus Pacebacteria bacterium]|nr:hypothetical protein [Candidatus Paceibacterota bacterium]